MIEDPCNRGSEMILRAGCRSLGGLERVLAHVLLKAHRQHAFDELCINKIKKKDQQRTTMISSYRRLQTCHWCCCCYWVAEADWGAAGTRDGPEGLEQVPHQLATAGMV